MPIISIFKNIGQVRDPEDIELIDYLEGIRDGRWEDIVTQCRNIKDEEEKKAYKNRMPTACMSGQFDHRADIGLTEHSGILALDLDDLENLNVIKRILMQDKYVLVVYMSAGGYGLRVLFKVDPKKHKKAFEGICEYLYEKYGIASSIDVNGSNVSKPYIVSFDPEAYIAIEFDEVPVFKKYIKELPIKQIADFAHTTADFDMVFKQVIGRGINLCDDYHTWLKLGFALSEQFGEDGRDYYHELSKMSSKYKHSVCDKQFTACLRAKGTGNPVNISTFYYLAQKNGVAVVSEQTRTIVRATKNGKKAGLKPDQIITNLKQFESIEGADELVNKVFEEGSVLTEEEESILHLLEMYIANNYSLRMNEVTGYLEQNEKPLTPSDLNTVFIAAKKVIPKLDYHLLIRLLKSDFIETYNPFYKFWNSDGIPVILPATPVKYPPAYKSPLIDTLASTIKNDDPKYVVFFLRKWLVSCVSAAHKVHSPLLLCLLGGQNTGKTEWFRRLPPAELRGYYAESKLDKGKDDELLLTENLWVLDDEFGGKSKQDNLKLNNITSQQYFSLRRPYGDHNEKILRLAVLCGTSNYFNVFNDPTGNRRIIPIEVKDIDKELYNSIDKKELWLECYKLYKEGFDWRINRDDISYLNHDKTKYESIIKEREIICKYYAVGDDYRMSSTDIMIEIETLTRQKLSINIIGREMKDLGFDNRSTKDAFGNSPKKWCVNRVGRTEPLPDKAKEDLPF